MTNAELLRRIRLGADSRLELKSVRTSGGRITAPHRDGFADALAAMANSQGGTVLLGVDDGTRAVRGLPLDDLDAIEEWVSEICSDSIKPALDATILKVELEDTKGQLAPVLRIDLQRSLFVHKSPGGYFRRVGSSKREMAPDVLARLIQERSQSRIVRFDETAVPDTAPSDLDYALTGRFLSGRVVDEPAIPASGSLPETPEDMLRKLRIVTDDADGNTCLTLAGVLLCTKEPQRWLPHAHIQAVRYAGERTDTDYQTDARDIGVPIILRECRELSGRLPEYGLIDDSELRLVIPAAA